MPLLNRSRVINFLYMKKKIIFLAIILVSTAFFLYVRSDKSLRMDAQLLGNSFIEGLKIVNKKDGATAWILTASRANLSSDGREAVLSSIEVDIPSRKVRIQADEGSYAMDSKQVTVEGEVRAYHKDYVITASNAVIDCATGKLDTTGNVMIESKKFNLEGEGMQADTNAQKVRILKNVKATFTH